ncbi:hypothetical protein EV127DRAFT_339751 [Xylaria flabelliformis]|nr:hypothetical protein EV127DRAFT_339751 [Xylaria flabelliformis]
MCQKFIRRGICGHQLGRATWVPENVRECPTARHRARLYGGRIIRCNPPISTHISNINNTACQNDDCLIEYVLLRCGWICHHCRGTNQAGVEYCETMIPDRRHPHDRDLDDPCGHSVCGSCRPRPREQARRRHR